MAYVGGVSEPGCVFCNALANDDDVASLIVHRGVHAFVILNLYPYNTGHLMVVPTEHVSDPAALSEAARSEVAELTASFCTGLRLVMGCDGLNIGVNLGSAAGAGIADHLHQHIVPRWRGDANFMPILASTMVMPELLPATYAKVRAELERELLHIEQVRAAILCEDDEVVVLRDKALPTAKVIDDEPLWRTALDMASEVSSAVEIVGWAGPFRSGAPEGSATLIIRARRVDMQPGWSRVAVLDIVERGPEELRQTAKRAIGSIEAFRNAT